MKKLTYILISISIAIISCKKDNGSTYSGNWDLKSSEGQFDTTFTINISTGGDFTYQIMVATNQATLSGSVTDNGDLSGKINTSGLTIGSMDGKLKTSGTGNGNYILLGDTIAWAATKR